jgi:hypothetical protein
MPRGPGIGPLRTPRDDYYVTETILGPETSVRETALTFRKFPSILQGRMIFADGQVGWLDGQSDSPRRRTNSMAWDTQWCLRKG